MRRMDLRRIRCGKKRKLTGSKWIELNRLEQGPQARQHA